MSLFDNNKTLTYKEYRAFVNECVFELIRKTDDKTCNGCIDFIYNDDTDIAYCEALETSWSVKDPTAVQRLTDCYISDLKASKNKF